MAVTKVSLSEFLDLYPSDGPDAGTGPYSRNHHAYHEAARTIDPTAECLGELCSFVHSAEVRTAFAAVMALVARRDPTGPHEMASAIFARDNHCSFPGCDGEWTAYGTWRGTRIPACDEHGSPTPLELS